MSGYARFTISHELFRKMLDLPTDVELVGVSTALPNRDFSVVVRSDQFPEGETDVTPTVTKTRRTWDWGIQ